MRNANGAATTIRARRLELGLTQEELGQRAGINRATISSIESGRVPVGANRGRRLAEALETTPSRLGIHQRPTLEILLDRLEDIQEQVAQLLEARAEVVENQERVATLLEHLVARSRLEDAPERVPE